LGTYPICLGAVAVFFVTLPDTSRLLIISKSNRQGLMMSATALFAAEDVQPQGWYSRHERFPATPAATANS
jgi:hypothetical protein